MVPQFPQFRSLTLQDRESLELVTNKFPPYSDFNFTSLWAWNVSGNTQISRLGENIVILMEDYISHEPILLFCGVDNVENSLEIVFEYAKKENMKVRVSLVPQETVEQISDNSKLLIEEDECGFDYILSAEELSQLSGNRWRAKKNFLNRFFRIYEGKHEIKILDLSNLSVRNALVKTFLAWAKSSGHDESFYGNELKAVYRLLHNISHFNVEVIGVCVDGVLEGFSIFEKVSPDYVIIHFEKANTGIVGIYTVINRAIAIRACELGCKYINYEQDLGIPGLSSAKKSYNPIFMLHKFTISQ